MFKIKNLIIIFLVLLVAFLIYFFQNLSFANADKLSPEIKLHTFAFFSNIKSKSIAASCGFTPHGGTDEYTSCNYTCPGGNTVVGQSQCGGVCQQTSASPCCANGAINQPACNVCGPGSVMTSVGVGLPPSICSCTNGAVNAGACNICPSGQVMQNNLCVCANGATNPTACNICPSGSNMTNGQCVCSNQGNIFTSCNSCNVGQTLDTDGICKDSCNTTNVCGQNISGVMRNGVCALSTNGQDPNASCISSFNLTTDTVNPNGSVEFSWKIADLPSNIQSRCGFVDLTTPTPRPIPGLQNLSPDIDRVRINNIQTTTRFCLVCQFISLINNTSLGEAAAHQWVRVIRVGEN